MDLYGVSAMAIANAAGVSLPTARRWKKRGAPALRAPVLALKVNGDLGEISATWAGWKLCADALWSPEGECIRPGDIKAIPYRRELLRELELRLASPRQLPLL
jgi:hypothetical protein